MKLIELASPVGVLILGVLFLMLGYSFYIIGLTAGDTVIRDLGLPFENIGIVLMIAGLSLYFIALVARKASE